jgi:hypothetical protein
MEPTRVETYIGPHYDSLMIALIVNIGLGCKQLTVTNTLAYYSRESVVTIQSLSCRPQDIFFCFS